MTIKLECIEKISWLLSKPKRIKIAVGGRGSGKSIGVGDLMLMFMCQGQRICATREHQNSIDDSVHETLRQEIDRLEIEGVVVQNSNIRSSEGGEIFYKGLARNITSLKSLAGVDKLWVEEAESISHKSLKVLTPSIRSSATSEHMPEIWYTMNRYSKQDAMSKKYLARAESSLAKTGRYEDDLMMIAEINYTDNPWFPPELELERLDDKANLSIEEYDHIWGGEYNDTVDRAIIKKEWFDAAIDACEKLGIKPKGATIFSHDPADTGGDSKAYAVKKGIHYFDVGEIEAKDGNDSCDIACDKAIELNADMFVWDADGMGALLRRQIKDAFSGIKCDLIMYKGSNKPDDPNVIFDGKSSIVGKYKAKTNAETFFNKRSQYHIKLAQKFENTYKAVVKKEFIDPDQLISISSNIKLLDKLRSECCRIPLIDNGAGKIQIMSKKIMKSVHDIESPGMSDCLVMGCESVNFGKKKKAALKFDTVY